MFSVIVFESTFPVKSNAYDKISVLSPGVMVILSGVVLVVQLTSNPSASMDVVHVP